VGAVVEQRGHDLGARSCLADSTEVWGW